MYVGSKDYVLSLDLHDINKEPLIVRTNECGNFIRLIEPWNRTHLYVCGTGAYNPICTYVDRGRRSQVTKDAAGRPLRPLVCAGSVDVWSTRASFCSYGELYAGVYIDFMGTDSAIFRTLGQQTAMRTDQYNSRWLNDPTFIHAHLIPDSNEKNDDKLYFFFREKASEMGQSPMTQSRIGRICLNDDGGHCCLVNKWSTFLKARLICSVPGTDGMETHFDELRDVYIQPTQDTRNPVIYGVFSVSGAVFKGSAVCVYSMADIRMVFNGPFAHKEGPNYQWVAYTGKIPYPRPGTVSSNNVYIYVIFLSYRGSVTKFLLKRREFTTIAVDQVTAADGSYEVLFLGTDRGTVQKVIVLPRDDLQTEELVLEEVEVFRVSPLSTLFSSLFQQLYVGSVLGVTHLALHRCDVYGEACADCCLARDPYCAWDGKSCSRYSASQKRRSRRQDVKYGNPIRQCRGYNSNANKNTLETIQYGVEGSTTFLECQARSPHMSLKWHLQKENSDRRKEIRSEGRILKTDQGLLIRSLQSSDGGIYQCTSTEKNFKHTLVKLQLVVLSSRTVNNVLVGTGNPALPPLQSSAWTPSAGQYKDLLTILSQPEMGLINQYCQDYWQIGDGTFPDGKAKSLKELKEQKKPRNRRHHDEPTTPAET
uniref:Sema domain, immunoglobulin domain (Ig), short basic domain, secreted, (semaphorin) 3Fa n=1 Tax=Cynoglossus semilaevis TaxID=244447 RepID=A0A3P8UEA0_CYNSE